MPVIKLKDFSRGLWASSTPGEVPEGYCSVFKGVDKTSGAGIRSREGSSTISASHNADSLFFYSLYWFSSVAGVMYRNFGTISADNSGSSTEPFIFCVAPSSPDIPAISVYGCNGGSSCFAAGLSGNARNWGIDAPSTGCSGSATTGGSLDNSAAYTYAFTFYNGNTGCESNPSTTFTVSTGPAQNAVNLTSIDTSGDSQVTARNIYRTTGDGSVLYYLDTISDNSTTTYGDTTGDDDLGADIISYNNEMPANLSALKYCHWHKTTMFWISGTSSRVYYSRPGYPESVEGYISIGSDQHDFPQALVTFGGELYCVCRYSVYNIYGDNPWYSRLIGGVIGTHHRQSVVSTPQGVIWVAHDGFRVFTGGSQSIVAGGKAVANLFVRSLGAGISKIDPDVACKATYWLNEYIVGNANNTLAYDLSTGRWREIGLSMDGALHFDPESEVCAFNHDGNIVSLESGGVTDGGNSFGMDVRTHNLHFDSPVRVASVSIDAETNGDTLNIYAYWGEWSDYLGNADTSTDRVISSVEPNVLAEQMYLRFYLSSSVSSSNVFIHSARIEYYPIELSIIGDDPVKIPAQFEDGQGRLAFNFRTGNEQEACRLYRYDFINIDLEDSAANVILLYTQLGGSNITVDTINNAARRFSQYELNIMGPMQRIYLTGAFYFYNIFLYDISVHRSGVNLDIDYGDRQVSIPGYIDGNRGQVRFNAEVKEHPTLQRCYMFERLTYYGDPGGATLTAYIDLMHAAATSLGTNASSGVDYIHFDIDKIGNLEEVYFTGTFSPTGAIIYGAELVARPVMLKCRFGNETFEVPGYYGEGSTTVVFDFKPFQYAMMDRVYFFERLIYDMDTNSNATTFTFTVNPLASGITTGNITLANRVVDSYEINQIGRMESVTFNVSAGSAAVAIYNLELIAKPLTLDIDYGDNRMSIEGHQQGTTTISFDLSPLHETTLNKVYFWERFMLDGDTNSEAITPQPFFATESGYSLSNISSATREVNSIDIARIGRMDAFDLVADFTAAFYINKLELIAKELTLDLWVGDQKRIIQANWLSGVSDLVFDLSPKDESSANQVFLFERLMIDADTGSIILTPKLTLVDRSEVSLDTFVSASREVDVIQMQRTGRLDKLIIDPIAGSDYAIYKLEMITKPMMMDVWIGDQRKSIPGYLDSSDSITFDLSPLHEDSTQQVYLYEKLLLEGDTGSNIVTAYITLNRQSEASIGVMNTGAKTVIERTINKTGRVDSIRLSGVTITGIYITKVELICKPLMLDIWIDGQKKSISGYLEGTSEDIVFDLSPIHEDTAQKIYLYEKLIIEGNTDSVTITPNITLSGESESALSTFSSSAKDVTDIAISKTGRIDKLRITSSFDPDIYLSKIEIICKTLKLDVFLAGQKMSVPGYLDQNASLQFDLSPLEESMIGQIYLFERLLLDGNTNDNTVTPYISLIGGSEATLSTFDVTTRSVEDFVIDKMGRLDKMRLDVVTWDEDIYLQHVELIANPIMLNLYLNGELTQIPGRYRDQNGEVFFEIYPVLQASLYTTYVVHNFFYDVDPGSVSLQFDLQIVGDSDLTLLTTSAASRTQGEIYLTKTGRPSNLTIQGVFTGPTPVIYKLELEMTARRGLKS